VNCYKRSHCLCILGQHSPLIVRAGLGEGGCGHLKIENTRNFHSSLLRCSVIDHKGQIYSDFRRNNLSAHVCCHFDQNTEHHTNNLVLVSYFTLRHTAGKYLVHSTKYPSYDSATFKNNESTRTIHITTLCCSFLTSSSPYGVFNFLQIRFISLVHHAFMFNTLASHAGGLGLESSSKKRMQGSSFT
jgi:hypothetical protein